MVTDRDGKIMLKLHLKVGRIRSCCLMGTVSAWDDEKILEIDGSDGCTTM